MLLGLLTLAACAPETDDATASGAEPTVQEEQEETTPLQTYEGVGVVVGFMAEKAYINIKHETIAGFMDAMTMPFPVPDSTLVEGIEVGDSIAFRITASGTLQAVEKQSR